MVLEHHAKANGSPAQSDLTEKGPIGQGLAPGHLQLLQACSSGYLRLLVAPALIEGAGLLQVHGRHRAQHGLAVGPRDQLGQGRGVDHGPGHQGGHLALLAGLEVRLDLLGY
jgi:hypothetical protein